MEGIAFSRDTAVIMTGVFVSEEEVGVLLLILMLVMMMVEQIIISSGGGACYEDLVDIDGDCDELQAVGEGLVMLMMML